MKYPKELIHLTNEIKTARLNNKISFIYSHSIDNKTRIDYLMGVNDKFILLTVKPINHLPSDDTLVLELAEITPESAGRLCGVWNLLGGARIFDYNGFDTIIAPLLIK